MPPPPVKDATTRRVFWKGEGIRFHSPGMARPEKRIIIGAIGKYRGGAYPCAMNMAAAAAAARDPKYKMKVI
jgi:hypothetical protein